MSEGPRRPRSGPHAPERHVFFRLATACLLVAILSKAQEILVPLALAVVIAFALGPAVRRLERWAGRALAIALVVVVALTAVTGFGYLLKRQVEDLSGQMTKYSDSMRKKVAALKGSGDRGLTALSKSVGKVVENLDERVAENQTARPVKLVPSSSSVMERIEATLTPVLAPLAKILVVLVLVIFLLGKREDLRDRFLRLAGKGNLTLTTRTMDEAGHRIGRFLVHQSAINTAFGVVVALGLFAIGIPYPPLWGFVAAVLRFVPFVGTILALVFPTALAFVQFEGWGQMLATLGLFLGLDALAAYVVEPIVIGAKTGVSSMAMLVSAIFWAWLWGPVGLVLSTPMTVCLAVLGRHVSRLEFLSVILSDEPALEPEYILYQRLLAGDEDEAHAILERQARIRTRGELFDGVITPVLLLASRDNARDEIAEDAYERVLGTIRSLVEEFGKPPAAAAAASTPAPPGGAAAARLRILGVSARNTADEVVWEMLARLFDPARIEVEAVGSAYLASEVAATAEGQSPDVVCIISTPPGGLAQARHICKRLRQRLPSTGILVIRIGAPSNAPEGTDQLLQDGATGIAFTLDEAQTKVEQLLSVAPAHAARGAAQ